VETEQELAMLIAAGCPEGQGYLFSDPVPSDKVFDLIGTREDTASKVA
jgi:EAL domain-containing protein (putative c-di-GMP-specific phosphodiesterase class I)